MSLNNRREVLMPHEDIEGDVDLEGTLELIGGAVDRVRKAREDLFKAVESLSVEQILDFARLLSVEEPVDAGPVGRPIYNELVSYTGILVVALVDKLVSQFETGADIHDCKRRAVYVLTDLCQGDEIALKQSNVQHIAYILGSDESSTPEVVEE